MYTVLELKPLFHAQAMPLNPSKKLHSHSTLMQPLKLSERFLSQLEEKDEDYREFHMK